MTYSKEVQTIFDLTISMLEKEELFDGKLLMELRKLCINGKWDNEAAISEALDSLLTPKEPTDG